MLCALSEPPCTTNTATSVLQDRLQRLSYSDKYASKLGQPVLRDNLLVEHSAVSSIFLQLPSRPSDNTMAHSKDFNGSPMMPGLDEDVFFDFDSAADSSTVALPIPQIDSFCSNVSTRAYEGGGFNGQFSSSLPLDYATHAAASRHTGTINGTTWNVGSFQRKNTRNAIPLTEDELQIIMAVRAMKHKTTQSAISLTPPPANELSYNFPSPEHLGQGVVDNFGVLEPFSPGPTLEFPINWGAMEPFWMHETPAIGCSDGSQSNP